MHIYSFNDLKFTLKHLKCSYMFRSYDHPKNNGYPINTINRFKTKLTAKQQKQQQYLKTIARNKKWVTFTYFRPIVRRITNLFKQSNLNIAFQATNTIRQQLNEKQTSKNSSGIYKLVCNTCNNGTASWSSGQSLCLLIWFPVLPWEFSLKGRIPTLPMVLVGQ